MSENAVVVATAKDLKLDAQGTPQLANLGQQLLYADSLLNSGMLPKTYRTAGQVVAAMQMAAEMGLKPGVKTLSRTAVINGNPSIYGEMPLAVCQASGQMESFEGYHFDKELNRICFENKNIRNPVFGYFFKARRKGAELYTEDYYTLDQSIAAGLGNVWKKHPEDMLKWRCMSKVLKVVFADILTGTSIAEYDHNTYVETGADYVESNITNLDDTSPDINNIIDSDSAPIEAEIIQPEEVQANVELPDEPKTETLTQEIQPTGEIPPIIETPVDPPVESFPEIETFQPKKSNIEDYVIKTGLHEGKKISDIPYEDILKSRDGVAAHLSSSVTEDPAAREFHDKLEEYIEMLTPKDQGQF